MANQAHYGIAPSINLARTLMRTKYDLETTFLHGKLIPLDMIPVMPGSSFKVDLTSYIRMSDPIVPIFGNITVGIHAFFVPWRLLWDHTEEFFGANNTSKGPQQTTYYIPKASFTNIAPQSVADYLGLPLTSGHTSQETAASDYQANVLKLRAYMLVWSEWYRSQQLSNPFLIDTGDTNTTIGKEDVIGTRNGSDVKTSMDPISVCKSFDTYTAATLCPQYGDPVTIELGEDAPVFLDPSWNDDHDSPWYPGNQGTDPDLALPSFTGMNGVDLGDNLAVTDDDLEFLGGAQGASDVPYVGDRVGLFGYVEGDNLAQPMAYDPAGTLKVDLTKATAVSVRDLRFAFAMQRYLEALNFGSRYFEILRNIYGTTNPDARLQRPEHIGQIHFPIQIQQVLSTAGAESGTTSKLGQAGANSVTLNRSVLTSKGFTEFGYLCIMLDTKHDRVYSQGLRREDFVDDRFDLYAPQFDHIGDFAVQKQEILLTGSNSNEPSMIFGYQEGWYNERYRDSRVSGYLNPNSPSMIYPYSLAETLDGQPELNEEFILEDRENIARVLKSGQNGPDYIGNFHIELRMVKPMSAHSLPGLIDHVGRL